jgi:hypothetical protein
VFQKFYTGNTLGIRRNKFQNPYFSRKRTEDRTRVGVGPEGRLTMRGRAPLLAVPRGGETPLVALRRRHSAYLKPPEVQTLNQSAFFPEQFRSATAIEDKFRGI